MPPKTSQLQIRISPRAKRELRARARAAGLTVSAWVMERLFPPKRTGLTRLLEELRDSPDPAFAFGALHDFLADLDGTEIEPVLGEPPRVDLQPPLDALVAAMIEHTASLRGTTVPEWVLETSAVSRPYFASELKNLRGHLLLRSPPAFRRRNLFIDTTVGGRV